MQTMNVQQSACNLKRQVTRMEKMLCKSKPFHTKQTSCIKEIYGFAEIFILIMKADVNCQGMS